MGAGQHRGVTVSAVVRPGLGRHYGGRVSGPSDPVRNYLREETERPLGDVRLASGRALQPISRGLHEAATNLLVKAMRSLADEDRDRAHALVARAISLPFDEHEEWAPAAAAGEQLLYNVVTNALEESAESDSTWLDAALSVLERAGSRVRPLLRDDLESVVAVYSLTKDEQRRLRAGIAPIPQGAELVDQTLTDDELKETLIAILEACNAYADELEARWS